MQKQTLEQLVQDTVNTFLSSGQAFSVYDVTTNIRNLVNAGVVEPSDALFNPVDNFFEISHLEIKDIFAGLYEDNGFDEPLTRDFNRGFFRYTGTRTSQPVQPKVAAKVSPVQSLSNLGNSLPRVVGKNINFTSTVGTRVPKSNFKTPVGALDKATVVSRVRQYVNGCKARGVTPTGRKIQSAIKRNGKSTGWSRTDLSRIANGILAGTI